MGAAPRPDVPPGCDAVSDLCPVEGTIYGYRPDLAANAFFAAFFGIAMIIQLIFGIKYRTWTYMTAIGLGCLAECVGYIGRVIMNDNPWSDIGFNIQIVLLIFAPSFLAAGIYLTLKHIVIQFGSEWSRLRPAWYTYIFIGCDITSLAMQSAGGALAATADPGDSLQDVGTNLMIAGIIFQVVVLVIFALLVAEYAFRTYKRRDQLTANAVALWNNRRFKLFCGAVCSAYIFILVRCAYRIPELLGGWGGELMRIEIEFIILEGVMIALAVLAQTAFHPGIFFPALASPSSKKHQSVKSVSDVEMEPLSSYEDVRPAGAYNGPAGAGRYEEMRAQ